MQPYLLYNTLKDGKSPADFRRDYHVHLLCRGGEMRFTASGRQFTVGGGDLVIWQMSTPIDDISHSDDFDADFLLISNEFLGRYNPERVWAARAYVFIKRQPSFRLQPHEWELLSEDFRQFRLRLSTDDWKLFQDDIAGRLLQVLLFDLWNVYSRAIDRDGTDDNQSRIFLRFLFLVQQHYKTRRDVNFYADQLCIIPKYLSQVCRELSGSPASAWIEQLTMSEIVRLLDNTDLSLADIADQLNFSSNAFFTRYVKRALGMTPSEYRNSKKTQKTALRETL